MQAVPKTTISTYMIRRKNSNKINPKIKVNQKNYLHSHQQVRKLQQFQNRPKQIANKLFPRSSTLLKMLTLCLRLRWSLNKVFWHLSLNKMTNQKLVRLKAKLLAVSAMKDLHNKTVIQI